ncbi:ParB/RepB/Spo0J family partition protein [Crossiella sp. CA198]|uniref:ParB/RepB/Spo0J family partition protein n=1 Tax=Crossiella sp. CA198 TaxID=3455607 RepID=UPI003F8D5706
MRSARECDSTEWDTTTTVPIDSIIPADSPRRDGEDPEHIRALAEFEGALPPILVRRDNRQVIDGMHRLKAAILNGRYEIEVRFFDGDEHAAFVLAVEANIAHGLPLSLGDRESAAQRIMAVYPRWSDRAISAAAGLSPKTVAALRRRAGEDNTVPSARVGRDGRVRPLSTAEGRRIAGETFAHSPGASLRAVARTAGISVGTARDVRDRVSRGEDPVPARLRAIEQGADQPRTRDIPRGDRNPTRHGGHRGKDAILRILQQDPSLRFTETGRLLLRWLATHAIGPEDWADRLDAMPPHSRAVVADLAIGCAEAWREFAEELRTGTRVTA